MFIRVSFIMAKSAYNPNSHPTEEWKANCGILINGILLSNKKELTNTT